MIVPISNCLFLGAISFTTFADGFSIAFTFFVALTTFLGHLHWRSSRQTGRYNLKSDLENGIKEGDITYLHNYKEKWSGSPWEGNPYLGGLMVGFSPLAFYATIIFIVAMLGVDNDSQLFFISSVVTLFVYFTWVCFRQNHRALKIADRLAKEAIKPNEVYKTAFNYWPTRFAMWMAPWLGTFYYFAFKKRLKNTPDSWCPTCGGHIEKNSLFQLPENRAHESKFESYRFEAFRCSSGHEYVIIEKGEHFESFSLCPKCNTLLLKNVETKTIRKPSFWRWGVKSATFRCLHCGETFSETFKIGWIFPENQNEPLKPSK